MWPDEFLEDTPETVFRFVTECCWTYNEADSATETIPKLEYVRAATAEWHACKICGRPLIIEK